MYALRERRVHVTQEDFELAVAKVRENTCVTISYALFFWDFAASFAFSSHQQYLFGLGFFF